jgi:hypothetical protein
LDEKASEEEMKLLFYKPETQSIYRHKWDTSEDYFNHFYGIQKYWGQEVHYPVITGLATASISMTTSFPTIKDCIGVNILVYEE